MSKVVKRAQTNTSPSKKKVKAVKDKVIKEKGVKKPRVKAVRTAPKRPRTAFILFMSENRDQIKKANPGVPITQISVIGGEQWKSLKPAAKVKYEKASEADKERYAKEMSTYVPDPNEKKKKRKAKDPNAPKRARSAYLYYVNANLDKTRTQHPNFKMTEVMAKLGEQWKALPDKDKKPFEAMAVKDKTRYETETAKYKAGKQ